MEHPYDKSQSRNIRVFISSTFNDMQPEREELISMVFPLLKKKASERQVSLTEIDLRWGITEEESKDNKVVQICLEEIDRSHPYFIGILGGRYGWCPKYENADWNKILPEKYHDAVDYINDGISMTELEILHGALDKRNAHAVFFIKESDSLKIDRKQKELRYKIKSQKTYPVHTYSDLSQLRDGIIKDFENLLDELYPLNECKTWNSQKEQQYIYLREHIKNYAPPTQTIMAIDSAISKRANRGIVLTGDNGIGKSTILAKLAIDAENAVNNDVVAFFPSDNIHGSTFNDAAKWICRSLSEKYGLSFDEDGVLDEQLKKMASMLKPSKRLYIIIDDIDNIASTPQLGSDMTWWPEWDEKVFVILSSDSSAHINNELQRFNYEFIEASGLDLDQRVKLANLYLHKDYNKTLSKEQLDIIGTPNKLFDNTMVFVAFLDEIRKYGSFQDFNNYISKLASFKDVDAFFEFILSQQKELFKKGGQLNEFKAVLASLVFSEDGLKESQLIDIANVSRLALSMIIGVNEIHLSTKNGKITFANKFFKKVIKRDLLKDINYVADAKFGIISYFLAHKDEEDSIYELSYQYWSFDDFDDLYLLLSKLENDQRFIKGNRKDTLAHYWKDLIHANPYRYDLLNIIYDLTNSVDDSPMEASIYFSANIALSSKELLNFIQFLHSYLGASKAAERLLYAMEKMLEDENDCEDLKRNIKTNMAAVKISNKDFSSSLKLMMDEIDEDTPMSDALINNVGNVFVSLYESTKNIKYIQYAQDILTEVLKARIKKYNTEINENVAFAYANLASAFSYTDKEKAVQLENKSLELFEKIKGYYNADVAIQYNNLAMTTIKDNPALALEYAAKSLEVYTNLYGENAKETREAKRAVTLAALFSHNYDVAWHYAQIISDYMCAEEKTKNDFLFQLTLLLSGFYGNQKYRDALEVGLLGYKISAGIAEYSIIFSRNIGKIYHVLGDDKKSGVFYRKAISTAESNQLYEKMQESLASFFQVSFQCGDYQGAIDKLDKIIKISREKNLDENISLAFAYYNIALNKFSLNHNYEEAISLVKKAIEIRKNLDNPEKDLEEYRQTLSELENSRKAEKKNNTSHVSYYVKMMASLLDGNDKEVLDSFTKALNISDSGNIDYALKALDETENLIDSENRPALGFLTYVRAQIHMIAFSSHKGKDETIDDVFDLFEDAWLQSTWSEDPKLSEQICLAAIKFAKESKNDFYEERFNWLLVETMIEADQLISTYTAEALFNIFTILNTDKTDDLMTISGVVMFALYVYKRCESRDDEKVNIMESIHKQLREFIADLPSEDEMGYFTSSLQNYLSHNKEQDLTDLAILFSRLTKEYFVNIEDYGQAAYASMTLIRLLIDDSQPEEAYWEMDNFMEDFHGTDDENLLEIIHISQLIVFLIVCDVRKALETAEEHNISKELINRHMTQLFPCSWALMQKDNAKAEKLFINLTMKEADKGYNKMSTYEYYDLALYCSFTPRENGYLGRNYLRKWTEKVGLSDKENSCYMSSYKTIAEALF